MTGLILDRSCGSNHSCLNLWAQQLWHVHSYFTALFLNFGLLRSFFPFFQRAEQRSLLRIVLSNDSSGSHMSVCHLFPRGWGSNTWPHASLGKCFITKLHRYPMEPILTCQAFFSLLMGDSSLCTVVNGAECEKMHPKYPLTSGILGKQDNFAKFIF